MYLFGQQLFTESVEADELARQEASVYEAFRHQHDFTDELKVWDHHGTRSGQLAHAILISILNKRTVMGENHSPFISDLKRALRFSGSSALPA